MKKILSTLIICFATNLLIGQTVFRDYVDGVVYVKFIPWALKQASRENPNNIPLNKLSTVSEVLSKYGVTKAYKPFYQADDDANLPFVVKFEFNQINKVNEFVNEISKVYGVEYAEKVPVMSTDVTPNDLNNVSMAYLNQINAPAAWNVFNGNSNITVAIVDNAVKWNHADLAANTYTNMAEFGGVAGVDDDANGYIDDIHGYDVADYDNDPIPTNNAMDHGTHCAGDAGGVNNNGLGIASIGWNIKIIPVKCTPNTGSVSSIYNGYGGIIYAVKAKARVISCSWGGATFAQTEQNVITYAWNKGCILVIAAGNNNSNAPHYPGAYNNVYCVAACGTGINGLAGETVNVKSSFSNYGTPGNQWVDIMSPGNQIYSTVPTGYAFFDGTSMATPIVAGLCGLMLSKCPYMTPQNVLNCISSTAANIYTLAGNASYSTGLQLGAGRIDAAAAMNCAASFSTTPPVANFFAMDRITCPNTPVKFTDSSLYLFPVPAWSWTFQAGIPATSSSSAPVVQWAAPGTYSVRMSITTPNGTNAITKLTYINVANAGPLNLNEGFQAAAFLPAGWQQDSYDPIYWQRTTAVGGFTVPGASALFDNASQDVQGDRDEMRTPRYTFTNVAVAHIRWDHAYQFLDPVESDSLEVNLSTNCGATWNQIYFNGGVPLATATGTQFALFVPTAGQWTKDSVNITGATAGQGNVSFKFVNHGHFGQGIYVDNINLFFPAPTANFNVPAAVCPGTSVTFTNTTTGAASYSWSLPGASPNTSTLSNPVVTYSAGGTYTAIQTAFNGTTSIAVTKTLTMNSTPTIAVNNQTICAGGQATITAGGAGTYSWSNGFNGNPLLVSPPSNTVYTVTGNLLGCTNTNTVSVTIGTMLAIFVSPSQATVCSGGASTLTASGAVNYTWSNNSNANPIVTTPTSNITFSIVGSNGACTGTTAITISVVATPSINLSASPSVSICLGQTTTLTASGSYSSFTWATPTVVANSITVNPVVNTTYTVTGSAAGGCATSSLMNVFIKPLPGTVMTMTNASCAGCPDGIAAVTVTAGVGPYTYQWLPAGGTQSIVNGATDGCYTVIVTGGNGCQKQDTICIGVGSVPTGIKTQQNQNIKALTIYPNPAHEFVRIEGQGLTFGYTIYNSLGQLILEKAINQNMAFIQTTEFAKGLYTIVVDLGNEKLRKKLVIE